jgi:hypothetical protein
VPRVLAHLQTMPAASKRSLQYGEQLQLNTGFVLNLHLALKLVLVELAAFGAVFPTLNLGFYKLSIRILMFCHLRNVPGNPSSFPSSSWSCSSSFLSTAVDITSLIYSRWQKSRRKH